MGEGDGRPTVHVSNLTIDATSIKDINSWTILVQFILFVVFNT